MIYWKRFVSVSQYGSSIAFTVLTNIILSLLSVITGIMVARLLGPGGRGELLTIQIYPQFLATVSLLGMADAVAYYSADDSESAGSYLFSALLIALLACIPFSLIGFYGIPLILDQKPSQIINSATIYLFYLPVNALLLIFVQSLRGRNQIITWNILRILPTASWLVILILNFLILEASPSSLAIQFLFALTLLIGVFGIFSLRGLHRPYHVNLKIVKKLLIYGIPVALSGLPLVFNLRLDQLILPRYVDSTLVGFYVVAVSWSTITNPIINAIADVMLPKIASNQSMDRRNEILAQTARLGFLLSFVIGLLTALLTPLIIPLLFGQDYRGAIPAGILLSLAACFLSFNQILRSGALSIAKPKIVFIVEGLGLVCTVLILYALLAPLNIIGAAIASLASYAIISVGFLISLHFTTQIKICDLTIPTKRDFNLIKQKIKLFART